MNPPTLTVEDVLTALARKGIPLPFEMGTFVVLQACEQLLARGVAGPIPRVTAAVVWFNDDGEVMVLEAPNAADEAAACRALVELLGALLVRSAPGVPQMLLELVEQGPSDGAWSLRRLRDDLEASLLPLNRSATRRVLSRLLREVKREGERAPRSLPPDERTVDRDVDVLFGVKPSESERPATEDDSAGPSVEIEDDGADEPRRAPPDRNPPRAPPLQAEPRPGAPRLHGRDAGRGPRMAAREVLGDPDTLSGGPSPAAALDDFEREADDGEGRTGVRIGIAFVIAAALLVVAYLVFHRAGG